MPGPPSVAHRSGAGAGDGSGDRLRLSPDARVLLRARAIRAFADGLVSIVLPLYLVARGFSPLQVGALVTATLLGSAAVSLAVGFRAVRYERTALLRAVALGMAATGALFAAATGFWPLLVIAAIGTLNPTSGDVSVFLPTEQALLPSTVDERHRTVVFARYSFVSFSVAAVGSLAAGLPGVVARHTELTEAGALRLVFVLYAGLGLAVWATYRRLTPGLGAAEQRAATPLRESRRTVLRLAALFSVDALAGGFTVQAILVLWLQQRHGLSAGTAGLLFFWAGLASGCSSLFAPVLARRVGLVRTMVFTHLPANVFLVLAALMPSVGPAVACLLVRAALSQMDVPARTSYVMAVVTPPERPAAASLTNVPRSLASAATPFAAGWMLSHSSFGWPLVLAGSMKIAYDLVLLALFRELRPPEEQR